MQDFADSAYATDVEWLVLRPPNVGGSLSLPSPLDEQPEYVSLFVASQLYGFSAFRTAKGFGLVQTADLLAALKNGAKNQDTPIAASIIKSVDHDDRILHIALSVDEETVITADTAGAIRGYSASAILDGPASVQPLWKIALDKDDLITDLRVNPGALKSTLAVLTQSGHVRLVDYASPTKTASKLAINATATSLCWSPQGKSLVVGTSEGNLITCASDGAVKKTIPPPVSPCDCQVQEVIWITQKSLGVLYATPVDRSDPDAVVDTESFVILTKKDDDKFDYRPLDFPCPSMNTLKGRCFLPLIRNWDQEAQHFMIALNTGACDGAYFGQGNDSLWNGWALDGSSISYPFGSDGMEVWPIGAAIDLTSTDEVPNDNPHEPPLPASPVLYIMFSNGTIRGYYCIRKDGVAYGHMKKPIALPKSSLSNQAVASVAVKNGFSALGSASTPAPAFSFGSAASPAAAPTFGSTSTPAAAPTFGSASVKNGSAAFGSTSTPAAAPTFGSASVKNGFSALGSAATPAPAFSFGSAASPAAAPTFGSTSTPAAAPTFGSASVKNGSAAFGSTSTPAAAPTFGSTSTPAGASKLGTKLTAATQSAASPTTGSNLRPISGEPSTPIKQSNGPKDSSFAAAATPPTRDAIPSKAPVSPIGSALTTGPSATNDQSKPVKISAPALSNLPPASPPRRAADTAPLSEKQKTHVEAFLAIEQKYNETLQKLKDEYRRVGSQLDQAPSVAQVEDLQARVLELKRRFDERDTSSTLDLKDRCLNPANLTASARAYERQFETLLESADQSEQQVIARGLGAETLSQKKHLERKESSIRAQLQQLQEHVAIDRFSANHSRPNTFEQAYRVAYYTRTKAGTVAGDVDYLSKRMAELCASRPDLDSLGAAHHSGRYGLLDDIDYEMPSLSPNRSEAVEALQKNIQARRDLQSRLNDHAHQERVVARTIEFKPRFGLRGHINAIVAAANKSSSEKKALEEQQQQQQLSLQSLAKPIAVDASTSPTTADDAVSSPVKFDDTDDASSWHCPMCSRQCMCATTSPEHLACPSTPESGSKAAPPPPAPGFATFVARATQTPSEQSPVATPFKFGALPSAPADEAATTDKPQADSGDQADQKVQDASGKVSAKADTEPPKLIFGFSVVEFAAPKPVEGAQKAPAASKPAFDFAAVGFSMPKPAEGSWKCPVCDITNTKDKVKCAACEAPNPSGSASVNGSDENSSAKKPAPAFSFGAAAGGSSSSGFGSSAFGANGGFGSSSSSSSIFNAAGGFGFGTGGASGVSTSTAATAGFSFGGVPSIPASASADTTTDNSKGLSDVSASDEDVSEDDLDGSEDYDDVGQDSEDESYGISEHEDDTDSDEGSQKDPDNISEIEIRTSSSPQPKPAFDFAAVGFSMPKPAEGSWKCPVCDITNTKDKVKCAACEAPNPSGSASANGSEQKSSSPQPKPAFDFAAVGFSMPKPAEGSWKCPVCDITNTKDKVKCAACEAPNPSGSASANGSEQKSSSPQPKPAFDFAAVGFSMPKPAEGSWKCPVCDITNTKDKVKCAACEAPNPSGSASVNGSDENSSAKKPAPAFSFGAAAGGSSSSGFGSSAFGANGGFGSSSSSSSIFNAAGGFGFGTGGASGVSTSTAATAGFSFGGVPSIPASASTSKPSEDSSKTNPVPSQSTTKLDGASPTKTDESVAKPIASAPDVKFGASGFASASASGSLRLPNASLNFASSPSASGSLSFASAPSTGFGLDGKQKANAPSSLGSSPVHVSNVSSFRGESMSDDGDISDEYDRFSDIDQDDKDENTPSGNLDETITSSGFFQSQSLGSTSLAASRFGAANPRSPPVSGPVFGTFGASDSGNRQTAFGAGPAFSKPSIPAPTSFESFATRPSTAFGQPSPMPSVFGGAGSASGGIPAFGQASMPSAPKFGQASAPAAPAFGQVAGVSAFGGVASSQPANAPRFGGDSSRVFGQSNAASETSSTSFARPKRVFLELPLSDIRIHIDMTLLNAASFVEHDLSPMNMRSILDEASDVGSPEIKSSAFCIHSVQTPLPAPTIDLDLAARGPNSSLFSPVGSSLRPFVDIGQDAYEPPASAKTPRLRRKSSIPILSPALRSGLAEPSFPGATSRSPSSTLSSNSPSPNSATERLSQKTLLRKSSIPVMSPPALTGADLTNQLGALRLDKSRIAHQAATGISMTPIKRTSIFRHLSKDTPPEPGRQDPPLFADSLVELAKQSQAPVAAVPRAVESKGSDDAETHPRVRKLQSGKSLRSSPRLAAKRSQELTRNSAVLGDSIRKDEQATGHLHWPGLSNSGESNAIDIPSADSAPYPGGEMELFLSPPKTSTVGMIPNASSEGVVGFTSPPDQRNGVILDSPLAALTSAMELVSQEPTVQEQTAGGHLIAQDNIPHFFEPRLSPQELASGFPPMDEYFAAQSFPLGRLDGSDRSEGPFLFTPKRDARGRYIPEYEAPTPKAEGKVDILNSPGIGFRKLPSTPAALRAQNKSQSQLSSPTRTKGPAPEQQLELKAETKKSNGKVLQNIQNYKAHGDQPQQVARPVATQQVLLNKNKVLAQLNFQRQQQQQPQQQQQQITLQQQTQELQLHVQAKLAENPVQTAVILGSRSGSQPRNIKVEIPTISYDDASKYTLLLCNLGEKPVPWSLERLGRTYADSSASSTRGPGAPLQALADETVFRHSQNSGRLGAFETLAISIDFTPKPMAAKYTQKYQLRSQSRMTHLQFEIDVTRPRITPTPTSMSSSGTSVSGPLGSSASVLKRSIKSGAIDAVSKMGDGLAASKTHTRANALRGQVRPPGIREVRKTRATQAADRAATRPLKTRSHMVARHRTNLEARLELRDHQAPYAAPKAIASTAIGETMPRKAVASQGAPSRAAAPVASYTALSSKRRDIELQVSGARSPKLIDFYEALGPTPLGQAATQVLTVHNNNTKKTIIVEVMVGKPFTILKERRFKIESGKSRSVEIEYRPERTGPVKDTLIVKGGNDILRVALAAQAV
ncbi:uncharacterized protein BJ171DRAFT_586786 [Polychytrium aggregatum]|uniref:uncharacterized protein n=1 Tax=Polychytrium aggregatum TaxID=110093 RepID=UPI0022FE1E33|nr:uncharacterized protein BJ171DRAFT_586786 [Polychytrium aggregatum]KAI9193659.1 hypothetical protein BJ171DRAFT_586786 [Polychytrium aggregatum]